MFECYVHVCCGWLCNVGACLCVAVFVVDWCLNLMRGYVVIGYVKLVCVCVFAVVVDDLVFTFDVRLCFDWIFKFCVCFCFAVFAIDRCLNLMLGYVVLGYVKFACVFGLPLKLMTFA